MSEVTIITTGSLSCCLNLLEPGAGNITVTVPVRCILLKCPTGYWLFDAGQTPPEIPQDPHAPFKIIADGSQTAAAQLRLMGITPAGIVISHVHRDHTAGLRDFPGIRTLIQRREAETSAGKELLQKYPQAWEIIDGEYDFSGDGSALAVPTFRHTPGHQSLLIRNGSSETLYAIDAAYTENCIADAPELEPFRCRRITIIPGHPVIR